MRIITQTEVDLLLKEGVGFRSFMGGTVPDGSAQLIVCAGGKYHLLEQGETIPAKIEAIMNQESDQHMQDIGWGR